MKDFRSEPEGSLGAVFGEVVALRSGTSISGYSDESLCVDPQIVPDPDLNRITLAVPLGRLGPLSGGTAGKNVDFSVMTYTVVRAGEAPRNAGMSSG